MFQWYCYTDYQTTCGSVVYSNKLIGNYSNRWFEMSSGEVFIDIPLSQEASAVSTTSMECIGAGTTTTPGPTTPRPTYNPALLPTK